MGLPAPLLEEIESFAREATQTPASLPGEAKTAMERWLASTEELAESTRQLRERNLEMRRTLAAFIEDPASHDSELDQIIDALRAAERRIRETKPLIDRLKASQAETFTLPGATPGEKARSISVVDRFLTISNESAETLRNFRWQAMARRASLEDPGDAPIFDDPEELLKYLNSHSG